MMVDTRIYGYVLDGYALCVPCYDDRVADGTLTEDDDAGPLFSHMDDDPWGLGCDDCGDFIFDPIEPHPFREDKTESAFRDRRFPVCRECGYTVSEAPHVTDDDVPLNDYDLWGNA